MAGRIVPVAPCQAGPRGHQQTQPLLRSRFDLFRLFDEVHLLIGKTKDIAQAANEVLGFAQLVFGVGKLFGEVVCAVKNFGVVKCDGHSEMLFFISE